MCIVRDCINGVVRAVAVAGREDGRVSNNGP